MNDKMIEELKDYAEGWVRTGPQHYKPNQIIEAFYHKIMSRHEAPEPLPVLVDRAGLFVGFIGKKRGKWWIMLIANTLKGAGKGKTIIAPTYSEAEAAARKYLEGLEDKGGKI